MAKLLLMEDEPDMRQLIQCALRVSGHEVEAVPDGMSGLQRVSESPPDLILLDMLMPKLTGIEVLEALKSSARFASIPVLVVTASTREAEAEKALRAGASGYLLKPFGLSELLSWVNALLDEVPAESIRSVTLTDPAAAI